ncbi:AGC protein kinase [Saprolegnia diclina VS20]|uniref:AGC protein kinase n=1 Tax=Saprolegnia diclina (strain VS20) TaxID=1156394 RepID=T0SHB2_SAPDV|nr:AGC protein kinase [Saprolegnia diclina VS20]EQC42387.1 AGC protein kinase [Saprolegnia diclina VS20]|eukprot:XP_008603810.1 AGC protein kinase [Saprolegnia diclina VS20]
MPFCCQCLTTKGFNKFHALEKVKARATCKECVKGGRTVLSPCAEAESEPPMTPPSAAPKKTSGTTIDDFEFLSVIGKGAFGKVLLVRHKATRHMHAMKIISKQFLVEMNSVEYMKSEREIMTKVSHPFIIGLKYAFQTDSKVYLIMEYQPGGELFSHLAKEGLLMEAKAKFYIAEMVLAIEHLHSKGIIHRDLKPENVLISAEGHVKLTDFGLAKQVNDGDEVFTFCGTQEYMAPEMILGNGYTQAVDWWSLGALAYEMLIGRSPFETKNKNRKELHKKILTAKLALPKWLSSDAHSLLKSLLERNVDKRLGAGKSSMFVVRGVQALKAHPFFKGIDWNAMVALQVAPPMIPVIRSETDTSNFDAEFTGLPPTDLDCSEFGGDRDTFRGFSFCEGDRRSSLDAKKTSTDDDALVESIASLVLHRTRSMSRRGSIELSAHDPQY